MRARCKCVCFPLTNMGTWCACMMVMFLSAWLYPVNGYYTGNYVFKPIHVYNYNLQRRVELYFIIFLRSTHAVQFHCSNSQR
jgi:hypothetical protein